MMSRASFRRSRRAIPTVEALESIISLSQVFSYTQATVITQNVSNRYPAQNQNVQVSVRTDNVNGESTGQILVTYNGQTYQYDTSQDAEVHLQFEGNGGNTVVDVYASSSNDSTSSQQSSTVYVRQTAIQG